MKPNWFVAIPVPAEAWLGQVIESLPDHCRAFKPQDIHLTIAFLGAMDEEKKEDIEALMALVTADPFVICLDKILGLPSRRRPSALSFNLSKGRKHAANLIATWRGPFIDAANARPDTRPPLPHVTIARPSRKAGLTGQKQALEWADKAESPGCPILLDRIALYTWADDRRYHQFKIVSEQPLSNQ